MKKLFLFFLFLMSPNVFALDEEQTDAAYSWLEVIDAGQYKESWVLTSSLFQDRLSSSRWVQALNQARAPLGNLESREIETSTQANSLPGAPDGQYVVITFSSTFVNKESSTETLTLVHEGGVWRPVGYFIK